MRIKAGRTYRNALGEVYEIRHAHSRDIRINCCLKYPFEGLNMRTKNVETFTEDGEYYTLTDMWRSPAKIKANADKRLTERVYSNKIYYILFALIGLFMLLQTLRFYGIITLNLL